MTRDYKPTSHRQEKKSSPFLSGLLVGLLMGIAIAVAFTFYIKGGSSAFTAKTEQGSQIEPVKPAEIQDEAAEPTKDRFEFYNILPGSESKVTEQEIKQLQDDTKPVESYFLQVGAFQTVQEADNLKAKLALLGLEAIVQTVAIPDKGTLHRVRVGPYTDINQISKAKTDLNSNGFKTDLIKVTAGQ